MSAKNQIGSGMIVGSIVGCATSVGLTFANGNSLLAFIAVIVVPLFVFSIVSRSLTLGVAFVWLNEQFFGMSGSWNSLVGIPGRGILLLCVVSWFFVNYSTRRSISEIPVRIHIAILSYAVLVPLFLLVWGVVVQESQLGDATSDVLRLFGLLAFYPVYCLGQRAPTLLVGWIVGASTSLNILFLAATIGPHELRAAMVDGWVFNGSGDGSAIHYIRITFEPILYGYIALFWGFYSFHRPRKSNINGGLLVSAGFLPTAINFLRGPIVGLFASISTLLLAELRRPGYSFQWFKFVPPVAIGLVLAVWLVLKNPLAEQKLNEILYMVAFVDLVGVSRVEQFDLVVSAWVSAPLLGQGVGSPLLGYSRSTGLSIEFQWGMILYRTGIIGLILFALPFLAVIRNFFSRIRDVDNERDIVVVSECVGGTLICLAVASFFNPYLASSITVTLFVLYHALRSCSTFAPAVRTRHRSRRKIGKPGNPRRTNVK